MSEELSDSDIKRVVTVIRNHAEKIMADPRLDDINPVYILAGMLRVASAKMVLRVGDEDYAMILKEVCDRTIEEYKEYKKGNME